jgi:hypothetical protein
MPLADTTSASTGGISDQGVLDAISGPMPTPASANPVPIGRQLEVQGNAQRLLFGQPTIAPASYSEMYDAGVAAGAPGRLVEPSLVRGLMPGGVIPQVGVTPWSPSQPRPWNAPQVALNQQADASAPDPATQHKQTILAWLHGQRDNGGS